MITSDFLGPFTEIFVFALILCPVFPESFQWVSPFLEASWRWAPLNCDSDFFLDPSQSLYTSQTQTETPICFSTIMSETLYSLIRIGFAAHQIQFTSILGKSALTVSECLLGAALLILEPHQAFTLPVPGQSCHFLNQRQKYSLRKMSPRIQVCRYTHCVLLKGRIAVDSRILGEPETHTSHPELLPATPTIFKSSTIIGFIFLFW